MRISKFNDAKTAFSLTRLKLPLPCGEATEELEFDDITTHCIHVADTMHVLQSRHSEPTTN